MEIVGIDVVRYGTDDLADAHRFLHHLGLEEVEHGSAGCRFVTMDQGEVELRAIGDKGLTPAPTNGATIRELVWGVASPAALEKIGSELERDRRLVRDPDGTLHTVDPSGFGIAFRVSRTRPLHDAAPLMNLPGKAPQRFDRRIEFTEQVRVRHIGHAVFYVPDYRAAQDFYINRLGFRLSDSFVGAGAFMRCQGSQQHHTIFMLQGEPPRAAAHHVAYEVGDFHEVMVGGNALMKKGWKSELGPGRHIIGSNYYWYFKTPCGSASEYYADIDFATDAWQPREWTFSPEVVSGWIVSAAEKADTAIETAKTFTTAKTSSLSEQ
jgi:catechol 2,3-dioxygenase-like lactoylglutathione lyase family enzyme